MKKKIQDWIWRLFNKYDWFKQKLLVYARYHAEFQYMRWMQKIYDARDMVPMPVTEQEQTNMNGSYALYKNVFFNSSLTKDMQSGLARPVFFTTRPKTNAAQDR